MRVTGVSERCITATSHVRKGTISRPVLVPDAFSDEVHHPEFCCTTRCASARAAADDATGPSWRGLTVCAVRMGGMQSMGCSDLCTLKERSSRNLAGGHQPTIRDQPRRGCLRSARRPLSCSAVRSGAWGGCTRPTDGHPCGRPDATRGARDPRRTARGPALTSSVCRAPMGRPELCPRRLSSGSRLTDDRAARGLGEPGSGGCPCEARNRHA